MPPHGRRLRSCCGSTRRNRSLQRGAHVVHGDHAFAERAQQPRGFALRGHKHAGEFAFVVQVRCKRVEVAVARHDHGVRVAVAVDHGAEHQVGIHVAFGDALAVAVRGHRLREHEFESGVAEHGVERFVGGDIADEQQRPADAESVAKRGPQELPIKVPALFAHRAVHVLAVDEGVGGVVRFACLASVCGVHGNCGTPNTRCPATR